MQKQQSLKNQLVNIFKKFFYKIIILIELQLLMMLFSWPILLYWGLPLSIMAPISNIIFAPFLALFVLVASFVFFTELFYIPNGFLIKILDILSSIWFSLLRQSSKFWLISCQYPGIFYLFLIPIGTSIIIYSKKLRSTTLKVPIILCFILFCFINFRGIDNNNLEKDILISKKKITFIKKDNKNILIDSSGALNQNISPFALVSTFIKNGAYKIDYLIILNPTITCFKSIADLLDMINITNIYMPKFKANLNQNGWKNWQELLERINKYKISLHLIDQDTEVNLNIKDNTQKIMISVSEKLINKNKLKYKELNLNSFMTKVK